MASYDQLLRQVEVLKMENSNLRQELQDNSTHLSKLETEASNMKEVLKQLQGTIDEDSGDGAGSHELIERLKEMSLDPAGFKPRPRPPLPPSSSSSSASSSGATGGFPRRAAPPTGREGQDRAAPPTGREGQDRGTPSAGREGQDTALDELEKERSLLLAELEKEEKEKDWYYAQLQNLTKRIDSLPLTENFTLQTDMSRRQLEFEARQIRSAMEEQLGSCQEMERRAQARVSRIQQIEKDILKLGTRIQEGGQTSSEQSTLPLAMSSGRLDHDDSTYSVPRRITSHLGTKVEMVYSLLSMLGTHDKDDMSRTLLAMSSSQDSCIAMRQSGCLPLLIQLLHGNDKDSLLLGNSRGSKEARARASAALHNIVHSQPEDKRGRREIRVLHLLEQVRVYCEACWDWQEDRNQTMPSPVEHQICPAVCVLMKLSFDEEHRHAMNQLGGLQAIAELLQVDCEMFGLSSDHYSITLRRYAGMALTNLTFGDVANKATLCSMKGCMRAMVAQLKSESEDLQQVIASVLRNLSWRADVNSKKTLREVGSVRALMGCALQVQKESTLKSVLSALWNLSAHCTENKADICCVDGALAFLVGTLTHRSHSNTLAIIESGGGILRNVSSLIATNQAHRQILREHGCLPTLLQHLKSHSLTIVSNACGTLWNLSARDQTDQETLWELGAVGMLRNLIHSRHKMIAMGSAAALRNLMANRPPRYKDTSVLSPGGGAPSLHARKQKALFEELDAQQLSETFDNIDNLSPKAAHRKPRGCGTNTSSNTRSYANTPVLSSPKRSEEVMGYGRVFPPTAPSVPSVRASSDSLNSVTSVDGYGNRGKTKPSSAAETFYSSDENSVTNKLCGYRKYPADLAHKIRSANHMGDDDGAELDTPINYSLKYSDEQLNSGRQSPSHTHSEEVEQQRHKGPRYNDTSEQPIDYSLKYENPALKYSSDSPALKYNTSSPVHAAVKYSADSQRKDEYGLQYTSQKESASVPKLRPLQPPAPNRTGPKSQESTQTYCVEDTPICFSRGSSLSSLSSEDDESHEVITRKRRSVDVVENSDGSNFPTLPVHEKVATEEQRSRKEAESQTAADSGAVSSKSKRHHHHELRHHHHAASGARTPKSPEPAPLYAQETPLMFSRCTSVSSLDSFSTSSIASSRSSAPCSALPSGVISPSDLPDSPGQTNPPSRAKTPPPLAPQEVELARQEEEPSSDLLLHFATEATPFGFSKASSLSALSVDEPYISSDLARGEVSEMTGAVTKEVEKAEPLLEGESDDDIEILEACINMAMPKSSRKPKKQAPPTATTQPIRKPSQLPVYKLLPPHRRKDKQEEEGPSEDTPRIYCVEGTPLNFSTATSLSDLTIESPPPEEATLSQRQRSGLPEGENGEDILAECISAAMPKSRLRKPTPPLLPPQATPPLAAPQQKKKPTSPVKPQLRPPYAAMALRPNKPFAFDSPRHYTPIEGTPCCFSRNDSLSSLDFDEDEDKTRDVESKARDAELNPRGTESKNESKNREAESKPPEVESKPLEAESKPLEVESKPLESKPRVAPKLAPKPATKPQPAAIFPHTPTLKQAPPPKVPQPDEQLQFAIEDTPVCFSRNSSLSSLSDIDHENNNKPPPPLSAEAPLPAEAVPDKPRPPPHCYAPKAFAVEDTPVCFSRNSSLSSLSIDSEDDLLQECISSAMPKKKKKNVPTPAAPADQALPLDVSILTEVEPEAVPRSPVSPDSESFDWKAIQEGANAIVSSLNAAAAASLSRQASSDSDSVLSLKSVGSSPFRLPVKIPAPVDPTPSDPELSERRGGRVVKPSERSHDVGEEEKSVRGGKKVYRSLITGKPRSELSSRGRSKPRASIGPKPGSSDDRLGGGSSSRDSTPSRSHKPKPSPAPKPATTSPATKPATKPKTSGGSGGGLPRSESAPRVTTAKTMAEAQKKPKDGEKPAPTLVRQSTFIKDTPSPTLKRKLEDSAHSAGSAHSQSNSALDSLSSPETQQSPANRKADLSRSHSESPSRPQEATPSSRFSRTGTWKRENSSGVSAKQQQQHHSTSLPRVGTWKRTGSSSSVLSASSESSERGGGGVSEREEVTSQRSSKGTWRKKKSDSMERAERPEDVWVRIEDCPVNGPRSASSCSARSPPVIDSPAPSGAPRLPSGSSSSCSNLNLRRSTESLDERPPPPQRAQPRGTVAARVSPFNYTPSPGKTTTTATTTVTSTATTTSTSTTPTRPSLIPTPVTKKREPKGEGGAGGASASGERGSYIVTSV